MSGTDRTGTREMIEQVALRLFAEQGFSHTSLQQIADEVGVTKAALYYYYPSKGELAQKLVAPTKSDIDGLLDEAEHAEDVDSREVLGRFFDLLVQHAPVLAAMVRDGTILGHVDFSAWTIEWLQRFQTILVGQDATIERRARAVVAAGGLARALILIQDGSIEEVRSAALDAACSALGVE